MEFDTARSMLSRIVLQVGKAGHPVGLWEVGVKLGYTTDDITTMFEVLEAHGILRRCSTGNSVGYTLDARFVEDALEELVKADILVSFKSGDRTQYFSPEM